MIHGVFDFFAIKYKLPSGNLSGRLPNAEAFNVRRPISFSTRGSGVRSVRESGGDAHHVLLPYTDVEEPVWKTVGRWLERNETKIRG